MILIDKKTFLEIPGKTSCKSYRQTLFFSHHLSHEQPGQTATLEPGGEWQAPLITSLIFPSK